MKSLRIFSYVLLILFFDYHIVLSQQVISNMGGILQTESGYISFTLGESVINTISTTNGIITQGYQQPWLKVTSNYTNFTNHAYGKVYPNPTNDILYLFTQIDGMSNIKLVLTNLTGRVFFTAKVDNELTEVDFSHCLPGIYILIVYEHHTIIGTYKIVKQKL